MKITIPLCTLALALLAAAPGARANDRPFQSARTAVAEDDDQVWSIETWTQRRGSVRGLSFEPEYVFTPKFSVQWELTRLVDREGAETGHEAEMELKYLFNRIDADGYGIAVSGTVAAERLRESGSTVKSLTLKLPVSIELGQKQGYLHLNAGFTKANDSRPAWVRSMGLETKLFRRTTGFVEIARDADERFVQVGVRHWIKREKFAIDFALQRQGTGGPQGYGFIFGLGLYDL